MERSFLSMAADWRCDRRAGSAHHRQRGLRELERPCRCRTPTNFRTVRRMMENHSLQILERFKSNLPLTALIREVHYAGGANGYIGSEIASASLYVQSR
jgi:hypothetical protein